MSTHRVPHVRRVIPLGVSVALLGVGLALGAPSAAAAVVPPGSAAASPLVAPPPGGTYATVTPATVFAGSFASHETKRLTLAGIPAGAAAQVSIAITAPAVAGSLTAYPAATAIPAVPTLPFAASQSATNLAVVTTSGAGAIDVHSTAGATVSVRVDVLGYYAAGAPTEPGAFGSVGAVKIATALTIPAGGSANLAAAGVGPIPAAAAVVLANLTVTAPTGSGALTAYPTGAARPTTQSLVFSAGRPAAALGAVRVGTSGQITIANLGAVPVTLTADVLGYFNPGSVVVAGAFQKVAPTTLSSTTLAAHATLTTQVTGTATVPAAGVGAVAVQLSAANAGAAGYLAAFAAGASPPTVPMVPFAPARPGANLVVVPVSASGAISVTNASPAAVQTRLDIVGYYPAISTFAWTRTPHVDVTANAFLSAISCPSTAFCMAGDADGNGLRFTGSGWTRTLNVTAGPIDFLSCVSPTSCFAVDSYTGKLSRWDGTSWNAPQAAAGIHADVVSCVPTGSCVIVGELASSQEASSTWNGSTWAAPVPLPAGAGRFNAFGCASATECFAAQNFGGGQIYRFTGSSWTGPTSIDSSGDISDIACVPSTFCLAVDDAGHSTTFNGTSWSPLQSDGFGSTYAPVSASCVSSSFCVAVNTTSSSASFTGSSWAPLVSAPLDPYAIACATTTSCYGLNSQSVARFTGTSWLAPSAVDPDSGVPLGAVNCSDATHCVAVGRVNAVAYNGSWQAPTTLIVNGDIGNQALADVSCVAATFCLAVSTFPGAGFIYNGSHWGPEIATSDGADLTAVSCVSGTFCLAVGTNGGQVFNGSGFHPVPLPTGFFDVDRVACTSTTHCLVVGSDNNLNPASAVFNGTGWSAAQSLGAGADQFTNGLSCRSANFCVAIGSSGKVQIYNGAGWAAPVALPGAPIASAVSCVLAAACLVTSNDGYGDGKVFQYTGSGWSSGLSIDPYGTPNGISCPSSTTCVAVDGKGAAVVGRA